MSEPTTMFENLDNYYGNKGEPFDCTIILKTGNIESGN